MKRIRIFDVLYVVFLLAIPLGLSTASSEDTLESCECVKPSWRNFPVTVTVEKYRYNEEPMEQLELRLLQAIKQTNKALGMNVFEFREYHPDFSGGEDISVSYGTVNTDTISVSHLYAEELRECKMMTPAEVEDAFLGQGVDCEVFAREMSELGPHYLVMRGLLQHGEEEVDDHESHSVSVMTMHEDTTRVTLTTSGQQIESARAAVSMCPFSSERKSVSATQVALVRSLGIQLPAGKFDSGYVKRKVLQMKNRKWDRWW